MLQDAKMENQSVPSVTFRTRENDEWVNVSSDELFKNKTVAVFSLPGAFTPTDGNGEFTDGMGMLVDKDDLGFGKRSWRYSMLVRNGVVEKMFVEPNKPGDPFEVSDADTMLNYLNPEAKAPSSIAVVSKPGCPFCAKAKDMLNEKGLAFEELLLGKSATSVGLKALSGASTVPQIFIDGKNIGGSEDLENFLKDF